MTIPNLSGVVVKSDVFKKGAADYIAWARIANYLHTHAPGWEFNLQPAPASNGNHVWAAPDGTGYLVGFFTGPDDQATADFPYAITDMRNNPIPLDKISARALTDSHRRALCAAAAFFFSLGWELWGKEEIGATADEEKAAAPAAKAQPKAVTPTQAKPASATPPPVEFASDADVAAIKARIKSHPKKDFIVASFKAHKGLPAGANNAASHIQLPSDIAFLTDLCDRDSSDPVCP